MEMIGLGAAKRSGIRARWFVAARRRPVLWVLARQRACNGQTIGVSNEVLGQRRRPVFSTPADWVEIESDSFGLSGLTADQPYRFKRQFEGR